MSAPRIGRNYPAAGTDIFEAWNEIWRDLSADEWKTGEELTKDIVIVKPITGKGLLSKARKQGIVEVQYRMHNSRKTAFYRKGTES